MCIPSAAHTKARSEKDERGVRVRLPVQHEAAVERTIQDYPSFFRVKAVTRRL